MRVRGRIDDNQKEVVSQLRKLGVSVAITSMLGKGFPDLVLGHQNKNYLIELKDGNKTKSRKTLTEDEAKFFNDWKGQVDKCESLDDICKVIGIILF
jgi:Holliday junction resolvase